MLNETYEISSWWYHDRPHIESGDELELVPEPENEHDESAIAVLKGNQKLGYIPSFATGMLHRVLDEGGHIYAYVAQEGDKELGLNPTIQVFDLDGKKANEQKDKEAKKSAHRGMVIVLIGACVWLLLMMTSCAYFPDMAAVGIRCLVAFIVLGVSFFLALII